MITADGKSGAKDAAVSAGKVARAAADRTRSYASQAGGGLLFIAKQPLMSSPVWLAKLCSASEQLLDGHFLGGAAG